MRDTRSCAESGREGSLGEIVKAVLVTLEVESDYDHDHDDGNVLCSDDDDEYAGGLVVLGDQG